MRNSEFGIRNEGVAMRKAKCDWVLELMHATAGSRNAQFAMRSGDLHLRCINWHFVPQGVRIYKKRDTVCRVFRGFIISLFHNRDGAPSVFVDFLCDFEVVLRYAFIHIIASFVNYARENEIRFAVHKCAYIG